MRPSDIPATLTVTPTDLGTGWHLLGHRLPTAGTPLTLDLSLAGPNRKVELYTACVTLAAAGLLEPIEIGLVGRRPGPADVPAQRSLLFEDPTCAEAVS